MKVEQVTSETTADCFFLSEDVQGSYVVNKDPQQFLHLLKASLRGRGSALL